LVFRLHRQEANLAIFLGSFYDIAIIPLSPLILKSAINSQENSPLKALDANHVGRALEYPPDFFVSCDSQQLSAATRSGLRIKQLLQNTRTTKLHFNYPILIDGLGYHR
jgi:hypothetical protein